MLKLREKSPHRLRHRRRLVRRSRDVAIALNQLWALNWSIASSSLAIARKLWALTFPSASLGVRRLYDRERVKGSNRSPLPQRRRFAAVLVNPLQAAADA